MKNWKERHGFWEMFLGALIYGVPVGLLAAPAIYVLAFALELVFCFFTCGGVGNACTSHPTCAFKPLWGMAREGNIQFGEFYLGAFIFCFVAATIIGTIFGISEEKQKRKQKIQEEDKADLDQRQKYANEFKSKASEITQICRSNYENGKNTAALQPKYESVSLQSKLWKAINDTSVQLQKLDDIVSDLYIQKEGK